MKNKLLKIYIGHSSQFDYQKELYAPLKQSSFATEHQLMFPHKKSKNPGNTKNIIAAADLFLAEVSYPSTGLGVELGWANDL